MVMDDQRSSRIGARTELAPVKRATATGEESNHRRFVALQR